MNEIENSSRPPWKFLVSLCLFLPTCIAVACTTFQLWTVYVAAWVFDAVLASTATTVPNRAEALDLFRHCPIVAFLGFVLAAIVVTVALFFVFTAWWFWSGERAKRVDATVQMPYLPLCLARQIERIRDNASNLSRDLRNEVSSRNKRNESLKRFIERCKERLADANNCINFAQQELKKGADWHDVIQVVLTVVVASRS